MPQPHSNSMVYSILPPLFPPVLSQETHTLQALCRLRESGAHIGCTHTWMRTVVMSHVYQLGSLPHASQSRFHDSVRFSNKCDNRPVRSLSGSTSRSLTSPPFSISAVMASIIFLSRPSEKLGTHSMIFFINKSYLCEFLHTRPLKHDWTIISITINRALNQKRLISNKWFCYHKAVFTLSVIPLSDCRHGILIACPATACDATHDIP